MDAHPGPVADILTNRNLRITSWGDGAAACYGWKAEDAVGKSLDDLLAARYEDERDAVLAALFRTGRAEFTATHRARDGRQFRVQGQMTLRRDDGGPAIEHRYRPLQTEQDAEPQTAQEEPPRQSAPPPQETVAAQDDSPEAAEQQRLLRQAQSLKRTADEMAGRERLVAEFLSTLSHEFKTPLSVMLADIKLLEYRLKECPQDVRERLDQPMEMLRRNATRLLWLSDTVLDAARVDSGSLTVHPANADVVGLVSGVVEAAQPFAAARGVELHFESDEPERVLPLDSEKTERIVLGLLVNAVGRTPPGGQVDVRLACRADSALIGVKDGGGTIAGDREERLFDRPQPGGADAAVRANLALAKSLTELLEGRIWQENTAQGGAAFFVELPALDAEWQGPQHRADGLSRARRAEIAFSYLPPPKQEI